MKIPQNILILIDFDNIFPHDFTAREISEKIEFILDHIFNTFEICHDVNVNIRLYGGWYNDNALTARASKVSMELSQIDIFPQVKSRFHIRGNIELATSLIGETHVWKNTYQEKGGLPKVRIKQEKRDEGCNQQPDCPITILKNFTKRKQRLCHHPECATIHEEVFFQRIQKMVDTMMACDILLTTCKDTDDTLLCLISDDTDLFPALSLCKRHRSNLSVMLGMLNDQRIEAYRSLLNPFSVNVFLIEE